VEEAGNTTPTPIEEAIPHHPRRRDVTAHRPDRARKKGAFVLPMIHRLRATARPASALLILCPTRELAAQGRRRISKKYGKHLKASPWPLSSRCQASGTGRPAATWR